jgi:hypothetical protein
MKPATSSRNALAIGAVLAEEERCLRCSVRHPAGQTPR